MRFVTLQTVNMEQKAFNPLKDREQPTKHNPLYLFLHYSEPYTVREARIHVRHIRDLLKSLDPSDAYNGVDCNSLSFLSFFTDGDLGGMSLRPIFSKPN